MDDSTLRFDLYVKSLLGTGIHTFLIGGLQLRGAVFKAYPEYFELNDGKTILRIPYRAVQYVK